MTTHTTTAPPQTQFTEFEHHGIRLRSLLRFPDYWAGDDGHVWSTKKGIPRRLKEVTHKKLRMQMVSMYHPNRRYWRKLTNGTTKSCMLPSVQYVHRLVASVWLPPQPSPAHEIDHLDENRLNNAPTNIAWKTKQQNIAAYHANHPNLPTYPSLGVLNPSAKLSEEQVRQILALRGTAPATMVAPGFGCHAANIRKIWRGEAWRHLKLEGNTNE